MKNVLVDVYHGFNPAFPYPLAGRGADIENLPAFLQHHVQCGRFGYNQTTFWTHKLVIDLEDVHDAYNTNLAARLINSSDTVLIPDYPLPGQCTAFFVVLVQYQRNAGRLVAYLDQMQPRRVGGCKRNSIITSCCGNALAAELTATMYNTVGCPCLDGFSFKIYLQYDGVDQGKWTGSGTNACPGATALNVRFWCNGNRVEDFRLEHQGCSSLFWITNNPSPPPLSRCDPLRVEFAIGSITCCGAVALPAFYLTVTP